MVAIRLLNRLASDLRRFGAPVTAAMALSLAAPANAGNGYASIVMHARTGEVLHAHQADAELDPGGLVKMMTVYLALHTVAQGEIGLADRVRMSARVARRGGVDPKPERLDTLIGQALSADADAAALAIAERLGGGVGRFADLMHAQALRLDLDDTAFTDPAGDDRDHATARDLAQLALALLRDFPERSTSWSAAVFADPSGFPEGGLGVMRVDDGEGRAHATLAVRRAGDTLVVVVLGAPTPEARDAHIRELLRRAFAVLAERARADAIEQQRPRMPLAMAAFGPAPPASGLRLAHHVAAAAPQDSEDEPPDAAEEEQERIRIILEGEADDAVAAPAPPPASAPQAQAAPPAPPGGAVERDGLSYGVQVGAYADRARAELRLTMVRDVWPSLFAEAAGRAIPAQVDGALVWRARFYDMTKAEANAACAALRDKGQGCLLLTLSAADRAALGAPD